MSFTEKEKKYIGKSLKDLRSDKDNPSLLKNLIQAKLEGGLLIPAGSDPNSKDSSKTEDMVITQAVLAEAIGNRNAFINFLTHPKLHSTITELKASVSLESLKTDDMKVSVAPETLLGEWGPVITLLKKIASLGNVLPPLLPLKAIVDEIEPQMKNALKQTGVTDDSGTTEGIDMRKDGGANGKLTGDGYAFIGVDPEQTDFDAIDEADENDYTKVKYIFDKIPEELK